MTQSSGSAVFMAVRYAAGQAGALTLVSKLALAGLAISIAVLVVVMAVVNGFDRELRERLLQVIPQLSLTSLNNIDAERVAALAARVSAGEFGLASGVEALAPIAQSAALLATAAGVEGVSLTGIEPDSYRNVSSIESFTTLRDLDQLTAKPYNIVLGAGLAQRLHLDIGDQVMVLLPDTAVSLMGALPRQKRFTVVDVLSSESELDTRGAFISLTDAQKLLRLPQRVTGLHARLVDVFDIQTGRQFLGQQFADHPVQVYGWMTTHGALYQAVAVQKTMLFAIFSFLIAVAAFNLVSGLMMLVEQRRSDIAILRSMGAERGFITKVFCYQGLALGAFGTMLGVLAGLVIAAGLPLLFGWLSVTWELNLMAQYFVNYLPIDIRFADVLSVIWVALLLSILASLYPALRAASFAPSAILAHEGKQAI